MHKLLAASALLSFALAACAADSSSTASQTDDYTGTRGGAPAPLTAEEAPFRDFLHVDLSTSAWPEHRYPHGSVRVDHVLADTALYLEADRTFTLYYAEDVMVDAYAGNPRTKRKLTGTWRVEAGALHLGDAATATLAKGATNVLDVQLPSGWAGPGMPASAALIMGGITNVGADAPFWSDYR